MMSLLRKLPINPIRKFSSGQSTVHEEELDKFRKLANEWWDVGGPFKPLHSFNKIRVPFIRDGILSEKSTVEIPSPAKPLTGQHILDIGCGGGLLSEALAKLGANVTGIDPCAESIAVGEERANRQKLALLTYKVISVEDLKNSTEHCFDAITASEVIEHVDNQEFFIQNCVDLLKPGGSLFITTINRTTASWALAICAAEYVMGLIPKGTHDWNKFITPLELTAYTESNNCELRQLQGLSYNPLNNSWCWSPIKAVNYAAHLVKSSNSKAHQPEHEN